MSDEHGKRKHRHDGPDVDHGAHTTERTTVAIQFVMGLWLVLTAALILYTLLSARVD